MEYNCRAGGFCLIILLFNNDKTVADWVSKKWGKPIPPWYFAVGILNKEGLLQGAATFHNYNGSNIELCYYGPRTVTKEVVKGLTDFVVNHVKVTRITACVPRSNKLLNKSLLKLGFKVEGVLRHYFGPYKKYDAIVFGILAEEAIRFLN